MDDVMVPKRVFLPLHDKNYIIHDVILGPNYNLYFQKRPNRQLNRPSGLDSF